MPSLSSQALAAFDTDMHVIKEALPVFDGTGEHQVWLRKLFEYTGEWSYFFSLREAADNWDETLEKMSRSLMAKKPELAVDIYLKENMRQNAMNMLKLLNRTDMYSKYITKLGKKFTDQYLESYGHCIRLFAKSKTGRSHAEKVREHLETLRTLPEVDESFGKLLSTIISDNSRRRTIKEALKTL